MIVPDTNMRKAPRSGSRGGEGRLKVARLITSTVIVLIAGWFLWVYGGIRYYADHDYARPADAIVVFGAAEYDGHPSPVLKARLDHALVLYQEHMAPLIITLGGPGGPRHTEGGVGRSYLAAHGVPDSQIIAETMSRNTEESARRLVVIARKNHLNRVIAVSDGTHLFRIHSICRRLGLDVYTSPRPVVGSLTYRERAQRLLHEMLSYTLWRMHLH